MITNHDINTILREVTEMLPQAQPRGVARAALVSIPPEDRDEALVILLTNQLTRVYAYDRTPVRAVPERSNSIASIRDSGVDPVEADKKLGTLSPMAHRVWARSKALGISQKEARQRIDADDKAYFERMRKRGEELIKEMAETERRANIAEFLDRRIQVRGTYKMLLDCTLDEVEWLAKNATDVAFGFMQSAAFYTDIANRMKESGARTVAGIDAEGVAA